MNLSTTLIKLVRCKTSSNRSQLREMQQKPLWAVKGSFSSPIPNSSEWSIWSLSMSTIEDILQILQCNRFRDQKMSTLTGLNSVTNVFLDNAKSASSLVNQLAAPLTSSSSQVVRSKRVLSKTCCKKRGKKRLSDGMWDPDVNLLLLEITNIPCTVLLMRALVRTSTLNKCSWCSNTTLQMVVRDSSILSSTMIRWCPCIAMLISKCKKQVSIPNNLFQKSTVFQQSEKLHLLLIQTKLKWASISRSIKLSRSQKWLLPRNKNSKSLL